MTYLYLKAPQNVQNAVYLEPVIEALYYQHQAHFNQAKIILNTEQPYLLENNPFVWKTTQSEDFPKGRLSYKHTVDEIVLSEGATVLHFDFTRHSGAQHWVDYFATTAGVNLLRRTPSVSNFELPHLVNPMRAKIVVELREPLYTDDAVVIRKEDLPKELTDRTDVIYLNDRDGYSTEHAPEHSIQTIQGADLYVGPGGAGPIHALAGGVRNIIAVHSKDLPPEQTSYPEIQSFMFDHEGQKETFKRAIVHALKTPKYPDILHRGNAKAFIEAKAMFHCRGEGLDVGSNQWPLPGALASDVESRQFDKAPFDFIFSSHCLEHIVGWEEELKLWDRSLRPGGTAFIYVPHPAMELWRPEGEWVKGGWHVWSPSPVSLTMWLHENTNIQVQSYNSYPDFAWSFCLIGKKY